jgi:hypothetical protein
MKRKMGDSGSLGSLGTREWQTSGLRDSELGSVYVKMGDGGQGDRVRREKGIWLEGGTPGFL